MATVRLPGGPTAAREVPVTAEIELNSTTERGA